MAVTSITEIDLPSMDRDAQGLRTYTRRFRVLVNKPVKDGPVTVNAAIQLTPWLLVHGAAYQFGTDAEGYEFDAAYLNRLTIAPETDEDFGSYLVTAGYGPPLGDNPLAAQTGTFEPIAFEIDFLKAEKVVDRDRTGAAVVNSAGDPYDDPPVTREDSRMVLTVTQNVASLDYATIQLARDSVNEFTWGPFQPRTVKCEPPRCTRKWQNDTGYYWQIQWQFLVIDEEYRDTTNTLLGVGWDKVLLDAGYRYKSGSAYKQILVDNNPVSKPYPLDGAGGLLASPATATKKYRTFYLYKLFDFNLLGFNP